MSEQEHDRWECVALNCDEAGSGDAKSVERAAERHTRDKRHATCTFHAGSKR